MQKVSILEATDEQIKAFAKDIQQIEKVPNARGPMLAALLESGWKNDYVLVDGEPPQAEAQPQYDQFDEPEVPVAKMPLKGFGFWKDSPMVRLKIMSTDRPGGNEPAHPSINGSPPLVIQRNQLVEIPYDFYLVLKQAGGTKITPGASANDELVRQDYQEYPMTDVVEPSRQAIADWRRKVADNELGHAKAA